MDLKPSLRHTPCTCDLFRKLRVGYCPDVPRDAGRRGDRGDPDPAVVMGRARGGWTHAADRHGRRRASEVPGSGQLAGLGWAHGREW